MEALQVLFDKIRSSLEEHEILDRALSNQVDDDSDSDGEESSESKQLKKDFMAKQKEIDLLKKAVPEGMWKLIIFRFRLLSMFFCFQASRTTASSSTSWPWRSCRRTSRSSR